MRKRGFYNFVECTDSNTKGASMLSAHEDAKYEYWCDGELIVSFSDKDKAINHYKKQCKQAPTSLHTIFKVVPTRKNIVQWVP